MKRLLPMTCGALLLMTSCADSEPLPSGGPRSVGAAPTGRDETRPSNTHSDPVEGHVPSWPHRTDVMREVRQFPAEGAEDPDNPLIRTETLEIEGEKPMTIFVFKNIETLEKKSSTEAPNHPADLGSVP